MKTGIRRTPRKRAAWRAWASLCLTACILLQTGCFGEKEPEPYYGQAAKPQAAELRWSAGGVPKIFDPARAVVAPDTDAVRALYEGLTEYHPQTLEPLPGVALRWEATDGKRLWKFHLRKNAKWSNGETVTARDFARSWQRVVNLGAESPHLTLFEGIAGAPHDTEAERPIPLEEDEEAVPSPSPAQQPEPAPTQTPAPNQPAETKPRVLGVRAVNDFLFEVRLQEPSPDFPALAAHTAFRPVYRNETFPVAGTLREPLISNGPFRLAQLQSQEAVFERSASYWEAASVGLERVRMLGANDAETALAMYRAGEVDVVTNANIAPLALKLLTPYKDFYRHTYSALSFYQFNPLHPPYDNPKVRQAMALVIDRERLMAEVFGNANEPARKFLPKGRPGVLLERNVQRARALLSEAGFPDGKGFPPVRLLYNRNEQQRLLSRAVANQWRRDLGLETEFVPKSWVEYQAALKAGDYDVARRSAVLPTTDETTNLRLLFALPAKSEQIAAAPSPTPGATPELAPAEPAPTPSPTPAATPFPAWQNETEALSEIPAVPLYFASSYSLVKPYILGFDANLLDAPLLKQTRFDANWQPPPATDNSWFGK